MHLCISWWLLHGFYFIYCYQRIQTKWAHTTRFGGDDDVPLLSAVRATADLTQQGTCESPHVKNTVPLTDPSHHHRPSNQCYMWNMVGSLQNPWWAQSLTQPRTQREGKGREGSSSSSSSHTNTYCSVSSTTHLPTRRTQHCTSSSNQFVSWSIKSVDKKHLLKFGLRLQTIYLSL